MTSNFEETSVSRNAKRTYEKIETIESFETALSRFTSDTTMNLTKRELNSANYKIRIDYFDAASNDKGYLNFYAADKTAYEDMASLLAGTEAAETAAGIGGTASHDAAEDAWSAKYSCAIGDDTFYITITREYMLISGFAKDETLEAVENWADTVAELGGDSA